MSEKVPPAKSSVYADEGTKAHELIDRMLSALVFHWNKTHEDSWSAQVMMQFILDEQYPREMVDCALAYCRLVWDNVLEYKPKKVLVEQRVVLDKDLGMFGTLDCGFAFRLDGKAILSIWDYKHGKGKIVEADSPQLIYYACAVQASFAKVKFDEVWLNVYQPRAAHEDGDPHRGPFVLSKEDVETWTEKLTDGGRKSILLLGKQVNHLRQQGYLQPGEHCGFCPALAICPAYRDHISEKASMDFSSEPNLLVPEVVKQREVIHEFDKEQLAALLTVADDVVSFFGKVKEFGINYLQTGGELAGWKIVEGRSQRKWKKETSQVAAGLQALGVADPYQKKILPFGSIETQLRNLGMKLKDAKAAIAPFAEKSTPKLSIAPTSDPRPAVSMAERARLDFADVSEAEEEL